MLKTKAGFLLRVVDLTLSDSSQEKEPTLYKWRRYESGSSSEDPCPSPLSYGLRDVGHFYNGNTRQLLPLKEWYKYCLTQRTML